MKHLSNKIWIKSQNYMMKNQNCHHVVQKILELTTTTGTIITFTTTASTITSTTSVIQKEDYHQDVRKILGLSNTTITA